MFNVNLFVNDKLSYNYLSAIMKKRVLILSPHADDEILGCGGFISKYSKIIPFM